jgi:hypothetical protein
MSAASRAIILHLLASFNGNIPYYPYYESGTSSSEEKVTS